MEARLNDRDYYAALWRSVLRHLLNWNADEVEAFMASRERVLSSRMLTHDHPFGQISTFFLPKKHEARFKGAQRGIFLCSIENCLLTFSAEMLAGTVNWDQVTNSVDSLLRPHGFGLSDCTDDNND